MAGGGGGSSGSDLVTTRILHKGDVVATLSYREKATKIAEAEAKAGVREVGGNNRGPKVRAYLASCGLGEGWPWCAAFVTFCLHQAGYRDFGSAGVSAWDSYAAQHGLLKTRPFRGDLVGFDLDGDGQVDDHIGFVRRVLSIRIAGCWLLSTVEGNTSSGVAGSQEDGDGVFCRVRLVRRSRVHFIRILGSTSA